MKIETILKKAIDKAVKNGWRGSGDLTLNTSFNELSKKEKECFLGHCFANWQTLIFSHDFARAFWGEKDYRKHLVLMVLEKEPLKYLEKFL